jgi:hypothetical protein
MWPLATFAAAGLGAASKIYEGFAKSDAAKMSAGIERDNAALLDTQGETAKAAAGLSLTQGAWDAAKVARRVDTLSAARLSTFAGRNIDPSSGSPLLMEGFSAAQGATDMALAAAKGEVGYADARTRSSQIFGQAANQQWKAVQDEQSATNARISGIFGAATSLLGSASSAWSGLGAGGGGGAAAPGAAASTFAAGNPWSFNTTGSLY